MEAIHVFAWKDGADDLLGVEVWGQRQLHEDAVNFGALVELRDPIEQLPLARRSIVVILPVLEPNFLGGFALGVDVDLRSRIFANAKHRQTGNDARSRAKTFDLL